MRSPTRVSAPAERLAAATLASSVTMRKAPDVLSRPHRTRKLWWSLALIALLCLVALFAPVLAPHNPNAQLDIINLKNHPPSLAYPFGTDQYSRDLLSRMLFGARISLSVAMLAVLLAATVGTAYGLIAGYAGGRIDAIMMRLLDACLAIPRVLLLVAVLSLWSPVPLVTLILVIGFTGWFEVSRLVRAEVLAVMQREYVLAARALGTRGSRIVWRHVLPNVLTPVLVAATLAVGNVIILEAGLSYLGIGARAPTASWGSIFFDGSDAFQATWWIVLFPGLAILITVLAFNTFGAALRDALDPHQLAGDKTP
ncbi:MAG TPA: ABC transporter permease [Gemmatimonadaceae bacterium]|nr:ABC transporter permease [Gemmatimonadaceae bacterium]